MPASAPSRSAFRTTPISTGILAVALTALPALALVNSRLEFQLWVVLALQWLAAFVVVALALTVEGASPKDIGFRRPSWVDLGYLIGTATAALVIFVFGAPIVESLGFPVEQGSAGVGAGSSFAMALAAAVTVGVVEEVLYRGYGIERLLAFSNSPLVAGGLTWFAFTAAHAVVWPIGNLLPVAAVTALFVVVYLGRRTLVPVVGAHVLIWVLPVVGQFYG